MRSYLSKRRTIKDLFYEEGFFLQQAVYSCGPTTIQNLQVYFGIPVTDVDELITLCGTSKENGTEYTGVLNALDKLHIATASEKQNASLEDLENELDQRCVCVVNYFNAFNRVGHFSLILDHDHDAFYLIDSSLGFLRLRKKYFLENWHNSNKTLNQWYVSICANQVEYE